MEGFFIIINWMDQMLKWMSKNYKFKKVNISLTGKLARTFASVVTYFAFALMGSACQPACLMPSRVPNGKMPLLLSQQCPSLL